MNYYDFYYDVSVPIIVEIRHEDMSFLFALEANIRNNKNMLAWLLGQGTLPWDPSMVEATVRQPTAEQAAAAEVPIETFEPKYQFNASIKSLFCDEDVANAPFFVRTYDSLSTRALDGVGFTYKCGYYGTCDLGSSIMDEQNRFAVLDTVLPQCQGGLLHVEKEGYLGFEKKVSTQAHRHAPSPAISLDPFIIKRIRFEKYRVVSNGYTKQLQGPFPLLETDQITLQLTRLGAEGEDPYGATVFYDKDNLFTTTALVPGKYELRATYIDQLGRIIPKHCQENCYKKCPICGETCVYIPEEDIEIKPAPWGGLELSEETRYWTIPRQKLYANTDLVVPLIISPDPECLDDLEELGDLVAITKPFRYDTKALPHFISAQPG